MTATLSQVPFADLALRAQLAGSATDAPGIREAREQAFERFAAAGIPTTRNEEWRFTPVRHLVTQPFGAPRESPRLAEQDIEPLLSSNARYRAVIVDGHFDHRLSRLPQGASCHAVSTAQAAAGNLRLMNALLAQADGQDVTPFAALNGALWTDGLAMLLAEGQRLDGPVEILYVATDAAANAIIAPRSLILVESAAELSVIETFASLTGAPYFTNAACRILLSGAARLEHIRVQREGAAATHIGCTAVHQGDESHYRSFTLATGGTLSRHDLRAELGGTGVETLLYGLYLGRGEQLVDNHTTIEHQQPDCNSWEVYKGVLAERARGVFNGKVLVRPEAQKTDAKQTNRNLLLSDDARVDTKPQLEIFADDVKCTHGATVGKLDEQQRFYLRSRGIAGREAQALLLWAFVAEVLAEITDADVRASLERAVRSHLDAMIA